MRLQSIILAVLDKQIMKRIHLRHCAYAMDKFGAGYGAVLDFVWDPSLGLHGSLQRKMQGFGDSLELRPMRFLSGHFDIAAVSCSSVTCLPMGSWTTERTGPATSFARLSLPLNQSLIHA